VTDIGLEDVIESLSERGQMEWELACMRVQIKALQDAKCTCDCCCGTDEP
jgi:hypothetical protein